LPEAAGPQRTCTAAGMLCLTRGQRFGRVDSTISFSPLPDYANFQGANWAQGYAVTRLLVLTGGCLICGLWRQTGHGTDCA
jgi:hypothetical protein